MSYPKINSPVITFEQTPFIDNLTVLQQLSIELVFTVHQSL